MQHLSSRFLILLLFFGTFFSAFGQKEPITISDLTKVVTMGSISISPDGEKAIFVKSFMEEEQGSYSYKRQLWMMDVKQPNTMRPISSPTANSGGASFSPDGKTLAFTRAYKGKSQIWLLPLNGGEAQVLTDAKYGASNPVWSPDGKKILFSSTLPMWAIEGEPDWEHQRPGRRFGDEPDYRAIQAGLAKEEVKPNVDGDLDELRAWLAKNAAKQDPKVIDRLNFLGEKDLSPDLYFSHLAIVDLESRTETTLTSGFQNYFGATWSPDGSFVLASSLKNEIHPDFTQHTEVWKVDVATQEASVFFALEGFRVGNPSFSPDGKSILVSGQEIDEPSYNQSMIGILQANGSGFKWLTESLDRSVGSAKWSTDSKNIYFTAANEGGFSLWSVQASNAKITPLISGQVGVSSFDLHGDHLLYAFTEVKNPSELYLADKNAKNTKQITRFNADWLATKEISYPKAHRLKTDEGFEIDYWVMEPIGKKSGVKYPTVLQMHGGPSAMWGPGEGSMWHEFQVMAAKGYGVVYGNPRGSGGYGKAFQKGNFQNWGDGPASDVLSALDEAGKTYDWIDEDQLFLTGGSYAGYLTAWIVGHDHRFKAAFAQRGVYELTFFLGEGNAWRLVPHHFGYPWEEGVKEIMDYNSPQTYVQNIQTPLLIKHGDVDLRTGVRQSELLYKSLKILGKPVEYVRYPDEGHELSRSGDITRRMDRIGRIIEFFERYVQHPN